MTIAIDEQWSLWLQSAPSITTFRVNTLRTTPTDFRDKLMQDLVQVSNERSKFGLNSEVPSVCQHDQLPELVYFSGWCKSSSHVCNTFASEVIVDAACGAAVLRGAHVFAPGVLGLSKGACEGDKVRICANLGTKCKRGWTQSLNSEDSQVVGHGILLMSRKTLFGKDAPRGVAVRVVDNQSGCPPLNTDFTKSGMALMQNLPSIVCSRVLNPQPHEVVLDLCAAPGNKTSHLSSLLANEGIIVALDRSAQRIAKLRELCVNFGVRNVYAFVCDSTKALMDESRVVEDDCLVDLTKGPPFPSNSFDSILLDAPCSGSGQRPRLEPIDIKHCASFPSLQKRLLKTAVKLLKPGGKLVYSTCSILAAENEDIVRFALDNFSNLKLLPAAPFFAPVFDDISKPTILTSDESKCVQKFSFNPNFENAKCCEDDTIGFFLAKFTKL